MKKKKQQIEEKTRFVKNLQNYSRHYQLIKVGARLEYLMTPEGITAGTLAGVFKGQLSLNKQDLLKWDGWSHTSQEFLKRYGQDVPIMGLQNDIVNRCQRCTKKLYDWFSSRVKNLYSTEIKEFLGIQSEIKRLTLKLSSGRK